jgi:hypothetical protein
MPRRNTAVTRLPLAAGAIALALVLAAATAPGAADARPLPMAAASHLAAGGGSSSSSLAAGGAHYRRRRALLQQDEQQKPDEASDVASGYALGAGDSSSPSTAENNNRQDIFFAGTTIDPSTNKVTAGGRASAVSGPAHIPAKPSRGLLEDGGGEEDALASEYALGAPEAAPEEKEKEARREDIEFAGMKTDMDAKEVKAGQADAVAAWRSGESKKGRRLSLL